MPRAHIFDLRYDHEVRAVPVHPAVPSHPLQQGRGLVARLRGLKASMDAERETLTAWMVAPPTVFS